MAGWNFNKMKHFTPIIFAFFAVTNFAVGYFPQDAASFERGLTAVERSMDSGKWEKASTALLDLLAENERADYVYYEKPRVLQDMERIALFLEYSPPTADEVLAGTVKKYDPLNGKIEVLFQGSDLSDFLEYDGAYTLPVAFTGNYSIEMSGARYPVARPLAIVIGFTTENEWTISFGSNEYKPHITWNKDDESREFLETSDKQPIQIGKEYHLLVEVNGTKVSVKSDKKKLFLLKRPKDSQGKAAFYGLRDYERETLQILIKGELEPSWIAGKIDAAMEENLAVFEGQYVAEKVLPAWLF